MNFNATQAWLPASWTTIHSRSSSSPARRPRELDRRVVFRPLAPHPDFGDIPNYAKTFLGPAQSPATCIAFHNIPRSTPQTMGPGLSKTHQPTSQKLPFTQSWALHRLRLYGLRNKGLHSKNTFKVYTFFHQNLRQTFVPTFCTSSGGTAHREMASVLVSQIGMQSIGMQPTARESKPNQQEIWPTTSCQFYELLQYFGRDWIRRDGTVSIAKIFLYPLCYTGVVIMYSGCAANHADVSKAQSWLEEQRTWKGGSRRYRQWNSVQATESQSFQKEISELA